jgi:hypothetical protein
MAKHQRGPEPRYFWYYGCCSFCGRFLFEEPRCEHELKHERKTDV